MSAAVNWEALYRRMRNVAAGYSNYCEETATTRRLDREYENIDLDARALKATEQTDAFDTRATGAAP